MVQQFLGPGGLKRTAPEADTRVRAPEPSFSHALQDAAAGALAAPSLWL